jgi:hypothetical protein
MPTGEQMDDATESIQEALAAAYAEQGGAAYQLSGHPSGRYVFADHEISRFSELGEAKKALALDYYVDWEGFSRDQQRGVIRRVLDGAGPETWMEGIEPADPGQDLGLRCAEMDAEEQASRLALAGVPDPIAYDDRVAEAYRRQSEALRDPPESRSVSDVGIDRIIDDLERGWCRRAKPGSVLEKAHARLAARFREIENRRDHEPER